ncbi:MAG: hypothetical protein ACI9F9_001295 [Candidatus Paceibacteria bacterium]
MVPVNMAAQLVKQERGAIRAMVRIWLSVMSSLQTGFPWIGGEVVSSPESPPMSGHPRVDY